MAILESVKAASEAVRDFFSHAKRRLPRFLFGRVFGHNAIFLYSKRRILRPYLFHFFAAFVENGTRDYEYARKCGEKRREKTRKGLLYSRADRK